MATMREVVFDCDRPAALARFWAEVLDGYAIRLYDDAEIARLAELGYTPETDPSVMVDGPGPKLCFQQVPEPKLTKNRLHLDVTADDRRAEVERLVALGGEIVHEYDSWTLMLDPAGNEFCVADPR